jgi:microsomal dipeptidase-like Zn-dependent dipeptidase
MLVAGCSVIVDTIDRLGNPVDRTMVDKSASPADVGFHHGLFVADLHADTLLWDRDILLRSNFGHVDLPRLRDGNVSLQVFTVVTKTPLPRTVSADAVTHCFSGSDFNWTSVLNALELRPLNTWFNLEARAIYQADLLKRFEMRSQTEGSGGTARLRILRTVGDLNELTMAWRQHKSEVGAVLGLEGVHWLGDVTTPAEAAAGVQRLFDAGFRQIALTHGFDNGLAGSSEGCAGPGLTPVGKAVIRKAEQLGMVVDLAHLSSPALQQAVTVATAPVVVSHTGAQGACNPPCYAPRNLTDADIQAIARTGGIIGIGYWPAAVGSEGLNSVVKVIAYVASVLRRPDFVAQRRLRDPAYDPFNHIALGSDFDGFVKAPIDASQLAWLTAALRQYSNTDGINFTPARVQKIAGGNVCRVFAERLPGGSSNAAASICQGIVQ